MQENFYRAIEKACVTLNTANEKFEKSVVAAFHEAGINRFTLKLQKELTATWTESNYKAAAIRKRLQRIREALKSAGWKAEDIERDSRGGARIGATATPKAKVKDAPASNDAAVLKRFAELSAAFLTAEDKAVATRLIAAIDHKLKSATTSKK